MKVVSLLQPWATLWALGAAKGAKEKETRPKGCTFKNYRGKVLIHASKGFSKFQRRLCETEPFKSVLAKNGFNSPDELPLGEIIGSSDITDCQEITKDNVPSSPEKEFGDYTLGTGRLMLSSANNTLFDKPIPAKGQLGLWNWKATRQTATCDMLINHPDIIDFDCNWGEFENLKDIYECGNDQACVACEIFELCSSGTRFEDMEVVPN